MPTDRLVPGLKAELVVTVDDKLVVKHMGGEGVLSTPAMIGLMERAGIEAVQAQLPDGHTTVGFEVNVKHFAATPKGQKVTNGPSCSKLTAASSVSRLKPTTRTSRLAMGPIAGRSSQFSAMAEPAGPASRRSRDRPCGTGKR